MKTRTRKYQVTGLTLYFLNTPIALFYYSKSKSKRKFRYQPIHAPMKLLALTALAILLFSSYSAWAGGLTADDAQLWIQGTDGLPGLSQGGDEFGTVLVNGDFNGDGFGDLAVGVPLDNIGVLDSGSVYIIYGTADGLNGTSPASIRKQQNTSGVSGQDLAVGDYCGAALAVGDFNGDDYDDLSYGCPGEDLDTVVDAGQIHVLFGSSAGLSNTGALFLHRDITGVNGTAAAGDQFGFALAAGDFNGDGADELVVGAPGANPYNIDDAGTFYVFLGSEGSGIVLSGHFYWDQNHAEIAGILETGDRYASVLSVGDFNNDGYDDLAVGDPDEDIGALNAAGVVTVIFGSSGGLDPSLFPNHSLYPNIIGGISEADNRFSEAIISGDFNGDKIDDLLIGEPNRNIETGSCGSTGRIYLFSGSNNGIDDSQHFHWDSCDLPGYVSGSDISSRFGSSFAAGNFNGDMITDFAVGAPGDGSNDFGWVVTFNGSTQTISPEEFNWYLNDLNLGLSSSGGDLFGFSLGGGDFDNDGISDLAIGEPRGDAGGDVVVLYGEHYDPIPSITPGSLNFYSIKGEIPPSEQLLSIANDGEGVLEWRITVESNVGDMVIVEPVEGETTLETDSVRVFIDQDWLMNQSRGTYRASIVVSNSDFTTTYRIIPVALEINEALQVGTGQEFSTIEAAVSAAQNGDKIILSGSTHTGIGNYNIQLGGKEITIIGENSSTVINCNNQGRAFTLDHEETDKTVIQGIKIINCTADETGTPYEGEGGAIYVGKNSFPTLVDIEFNSNTAYDRGGALYYGGSNGQIRNCRFLNNTSSGGAGEGGAVYIEHYNNLLIDNLIKGNSADKGGGAYFSENSHNNHIGGQTFFFDNTSDSLGGAIYLDGTATASNCLIKGNSAIDEGGGIYISVNADNSVIVNTILSGNYQTGKQDAGGAISTHAPGFSIINSTLYNNYYNNNTDTTADDVGDGIYAATGGSIKNVIIWEEWNSAIDPDPVNNPPSGSSISGDIVRKFDIDINSVRITGTVFGTYKEPNTTGWFTNFDHINNYKRDNVTSLIYPLDPPFVDPSLYNFAIVPASDSTEEHLIDQGVDIDWLYSDYRGSLRPIDGDDNGSDIFDIGAYEYSLYYGGSTADSVASAFKDLHLVSTSLVVGQPYEIMWDDKNPFPELYRRIEQAGEYAVNIALVSEAGFRIDLITNLTVPISTTGYSVPFTFGQEHRGTWQLRLEFADDPNQYILSEEIIIQYKEAVTYYLGQEILPPDGAYPGQKPDFDISDACYWSSTNNKLFATAARFVIITWYGDENKTIPIPIVARIMFPEDGYVTHVADSPPVNTLPEGTVNDLVQLKYANNDARFTGNSFTATQAGWSLLLFIDNETGVESFETIRTVAWNSDDLVDNVVVDIGTELVGTDEELYAAPGTGQPVHDPSCGNGYVYFANGPYDGYGEQKAYNRELRQGQIFPINRDLTDPGPAAFDTIDPLVVVWYQQSANSICWPGLVVRYSPQWPVTSPEETIVIASQYGTGPLNPETYGDPANIGIYNQPDPEQPGYNPNEEHALLFSAQGASSPAAFALRNDLNIPGTSEPYVIVKYRDPLSDEWRMKVWQVVTEDGTYQFDGYSVEAGSEIPPPYPLNQMMFGPCEESDIVSASGPFVLEDKDDKFFAIQGDVDVGLSFYYRLQEGFFLDQDPDGPGPLGLDGINDVADGTCIPWLDGADGTWDGSPQVATYGVDWPEDPEVPTLYVGETLVSAKTQPGESVGLPEIGAQCRVDVVYQQTADLVRLLDPLTEHWVSYPLADPEGLLPPDLIPRYDLATNRWKFTALPYHIQSRLTYDPVDERLKLRGIYESGVGEPMLLLNVLSQREFDVITPLIANDPSGAFGTSLVQLNTDATVALYANETGMQHADLKALSAGDAQGTGYVTLAFNNDDAEPFDCPAPTMLNVIRVGCPLYAGDIKVIESENPFEEKVTMRHNGDFGGNSDGKNFEWHFTEADFPGIPCAPDDTDSFDCLQPDDGDYEWQNYAVANPGAVDIVIQGSGQQLLGDKWFSVHYEDDGGICSDQYSPWTSPQLYEGWIKRVMKKINLFDQKVTDFHASDVNTLASMISLAGQGYEGDIALSDEPEYLQNLGMIEVYQTLLNRGISLSGTSDQTDLNLAMMFAADRLASIFMMLGNEAYGDAADPTIGFSTESGIYGSEAPSIFCFQNQVGSLLEEELTLLRGRDTVGIRPFHNRLVWNFTLNDGEVAYKENYNITDQLTVDSNGDTYPDAADGEINEWDARIQFPQGHGDAWGYYLSALKRYYGLLKRDNFTWVPQSENILVAGTPVSVDYRDERRFAAAAAAKAKTGSEIVNLTYRQMYTEDPEGQFTGYKDSDSSRNWGVDEWARRSGQGALFDWAVGNAMLPPASDLEGIHRVDRITVTELASIAAEYRSVENKVDSADAGLNPLGLAKGIVPFDIDPNAVAGGQTHFEQIYERTVQATNNAIAVFNHANESSQLLRRQQDSLADFQRNIENMEVDYNNRLIELFGYPYTDDCGPGETYPTAYCQTGPDLFHYMYVDATELMNADNVQVHEFPVTFRSLTVDGSGALVEEEQVVNFHVDTDSRFGLIKPDTWFGRRKAQGAIQAARSEMLQTRGRFEKTLIDYDNLLAQIETQAELLQEQYGINSEEIEILDTAKDDQITLNQLIAASREVQLINRGIARLSTHIGSAVAEAFPIVAGTSVDATSVLRSVARLVGIGVSEIFTAMADAESLAELGHQQAKEVVSAESNIAVTTLRGEYASLQQLRQLENTIRSEASLRHDLYVLAETLRQSAERYRSTLAQGERLINERTRFRTQTAAQIQDYRYKDMAFRIFRNDSLQKYRAQFDMAAQYVYLAAKAYDYETTLLDHDTMAGQHFLSDIVKQRSIGRIENGQPLTGTGLADLMRRMWQNFQVLKPQLGFNNPQVETNRFSLRQELFRVKMDVGSNTTWKRVLEDQRVDNIWDIPEFRRYCRPFAEEGIIEPGLVIPFSTTVNAGLNFFHWPLGGGDSYYSSSNFATKVRGVGVWFSNYNGAGLAQTPRVYLVPAGEDILRTPSYYTRDIRTWQVVDQKLPAPFPIVATEMQGDPDWIPSVDTIFDDMFEIRRHSDFRAYHDSGYLNESELVYDTRLIGRSVWNDRWLLIIPGRSLLYDGNEGIDTFIEGPQIIGGLPGDRTGNGVSDIKLFFTTYSYSGN